MRRLTKVGLPYTSVPDGHYELELGCRILIWLSLGMNE